MALLKELKGSFVGGQVSPELQNRIDLEKFNTFLKEAKNTQIKPEGGISNRAGTVFIGKAKEATFRLTINVNVTATIIINGVEYSSVTTKSVDLDAGSEYTYEVSAVGYDTKSSSGTINENKVIEVELEADANNYEFTITNTQGATITINGTEQSTVTEPAGTLIEWEVSKTGYVTQSGSFLLSADTESPMVVTLEEVPTTATLTIVATPNDSVIKINGVVQNNVVLDIGDNYTYEVTKEGYLDYSGSGTITENTTINVTLQSQTVNLQNIQPATNNVDLLTTYNVSKTGTYSLEVKGQNGGTLTIRTGNDITYWEAEYGGYTKLNIPLTSGDVLKIKSIGGVVLSDMKYGNNTLQNFYFGTGVGIWLNDECIVVSGGGASLFRYQDQASETFMASGSGYYGGDITYSGNKVYGINHNGTTGSPSTSDVASSADGEKITGYQIVCYGGSGYVKGSLASYVAERKRTGVQAFAKIEFIG